MKKLFLLGLLCIPSLQLLAQTSRPDAFATVFISRAMPSGSFYETDLANKEAGFAKSGPAFGIAYTQLFKHKNKPDKAILPGISFVALSRNNEIDAAKLGEQKTGNGLNLNQVTASAYNSKFLLAGFVLHNQLEPTGLDSYIRGNVGLALNTSPEVVLIYNSGRQTETLHETKSTSFAYGIDAGLRYNFGKLGLGAESSWVSTKTESLFFGKEQKHGLGTLGISLTLSYNFSFKHNLEL